MLQQPFLPPQPARVTGQGAVASHDPVAGHDHCNRVLAVGRRNRPYCLDVSQSQGLLPVGDRLPETDLAELCPDALLKFGPLEVQLQ